MFHHKLADTNMIIYIDYDGGEIVQVNFGPVLLKSQWNMEHIADSNQSLLALYSSHYLPCRPIHHLCSLLTSGCMTRTNLVFDSI